MGHGHDHGDVAAADRAKLAWALALIASFMGVEVVVGILANSVALLSDAAHMLTDAAAIALALFAARLAARPASGAYTFGLGRAEILAAQVNGASLLALGAVLAYEAIGRLGDPPEVEGGLVLVVAALGACVNVGAAAILARAQRRSLNVEGARAHVLADLYASVAAMLAGAVVLFTGYNRVDALAALVVVALMLRSAWSLLRDSGRVLLEASPAGVDSDAIGRRLAEQPGVSEVHDLHVWEVTTGFPALSAHVLVPAGHDCHATRHALERVLREEFAIEHTTLQVDHLPREGPLHIEVRSPDARGPA